VANTLQKISSWMFALMCQVSSTGPGFVTYSFSPGQPLAIGSYSVSATYTPSANFLIGSMSGPFAFTVNPAPPPPPPTSEIPCIHLPYITHAMPTIIARTRSNCHHHCCRTFSRSYESGLITVVRGLSFSCLFRHSAGHDFGCSYYRCKAHSSCPAHKQSP